MSKSANPRAGASHGRGTGVPDPIDVEVGGRVRARRLLIGMNQEQLAEALGLTFQQIQKYESGANRVSASRLWHIANVLGVSIDYFFQGLDAQPEGPDREARERMHRPEAIELIRAYYRIQDANVREQFLEMLRAIARWRPRRE